MADPPTKDLGHLVTRVHAPEFYQGHDEDSDRIVPGGDRAASAFPGIGGFGPRWALGVGAASGFMAAIVAFTFLVKHRHLRTRLDGWHLRFASDDGELMTPVSPATAPRAAFG